MTIDKEKIIKIPTWLVAIIGPMLITITAAIIVTYASNATTRKQVEINTEDLKNKVNRTEFDIIRQQLNRIELKLDEHTKQD